MWGHMSGIESSHSFRVDGLVTWEEYGCFGAVCVCDGEDCVVPFQWWQLYDEVKGDCFGKWGNLPSGTFYWGVCCALGNSPNCLESCDFVDFPHIR